MKFFHALITLALCSATLAHPPPLPGEDQPPDGTCNRDYQCEPAEDGHIPCCSFEGQCIDSAEACSYGCQGGEKCKLEPTTEEEKLIFYCYNIWKRNECTEECYCREGTGTCINGKCIKDDNSSSEIIGDKLSSKKKTNDQLIQNSKKEDMDENNTENNPDNTVETTTEATNNSTQDSFQNSTDSTQNPFQNSTDSTQDSFQNSTDSTITTGNTNTLGNTNAPNSNSTIETINNQPGNANEENNSAETIQKGVSILLASILIIYFF